MKKIPFTVVSKRIKYFEINLTKEVQDVFYKNYKILFEEIRENLNKWKVIPCTFNIFRVTICPKLDYSLNTISIKILADFFAKLTS